MRARRTAAIARGSTAPARRVPRCARRPRDRRHRARCTRRDGSCSASPECGPAGATRASAKRLEDGARGVTAGPMTYVGPPARRGDITLALCLAPLGESSWRGACAVVRCAPSSRRARARDVTRGPFRRIAILRNAKRSDSAGGRSDPSGGDALLRIRRCEPARTTAARCRRRTSRQQSNRRERARGRDRW